MAKMLMQAVVFFLLLTTVVIDAASQQPAEQPFAKVVPSAVIEVRDGPTHDLDNF